MLKIAFLVTATLQVPPTGDWAVWFARGVDTLCTTAHDRRSGARISGCTPLMGHAEVENDGLVQDETHVLASAKLRVLVYTEPGRDAKQLEKDLGDEPICGARALIKAFTPPERCKHLMRYILSFADGQELEFNQVPCSDEQRRRGLGYVRAVAAGEAPLPLDETIVGDIRSVAIEDLPALKGKSLEQVFVEYGITDRQWPRYPDGFSLIYPLLGSEEKEVFLDFGQDRTVERARLPCRDEQRP